MPAPTTLMGTNYIVSDQALVRTLPYISVVGKRSCPHSSVMIVDWETAFCGLCFLREGYADELPGKLHFVKTLADNGNPQQTGSFIGHVSLVEGLKPPKKGQTINNASRARSIIGSRPLPKQFPFASAVWVVVDKQPPLGVPLAYAVTGLSEIDIARRMLLSLYNVNERLEKAVSMAMRIVRKYDAV